MQPPSTPVAPDEPLYEAFYGLREQPFALTTDPRFLFMGASHRRAYEELLTGLRRREGLMLLTGETGTGKTTLCRAVIDALGHRTFSALILNPYMSDVEVLRVILRDFGLVSREEIRRGAFAKADMPQLLDTLETFLRSLLPLASYAVVIIDEAQSLPPKVLDQIRVLGSYEQEGQRLLQIVLVGQPSLIETLKSEGMRAVAERISRRSQLLPLPLAEIDAYIQHRLSIAGGRESVGFPIEAVKAIAELTRGIPRRVNLLCDRALEEGRVAGTSAISAELVHRAARAVAGGAPQRNDDELIELPLLVAEGGDRSLSFGAVPETPGRGRRLFLYVLVLLIVLAGAGGYFAWRTANQDPGQPPLPETPPRDVGTQPRLPTLLSEDDVRQIMKETGGKDD